MEEVFTSRAQIFWNFSSLVSSIFCKPRQDNVHLFFCFSWLQYTNSSASNGSRPKTIWWAPLTFYHTYLDFIQLCYINKSGSDNAAVTTRQKKLLWPETNNLLHRTSYIIYLRMFITLRLSKYHIDLCYRNCFQLSEHFFMNKMEGDRFSNLYHNYEQR